MTTVTDVHVPQPIADLESDSLIAQFSDGPRLVGTQCESCGTTMIGSRVVCSNCVSQDVHQIALPTTGTLYSFTRVHARGEAPRAMGYVDLDDKVRTLADLRETRQLTPDMRVQLGFDGDAWYFEPAADE